MLNGIMGIWEYGLGNFWVEILGIGFRELDFGNFGLEIWPPSWRNDSIDLWGKVSCWARCGHF